MSHTYVTYVVLNLIMFNRKSEHPPGIGYLLFGIIYALVAIGVSCGAVYFLTKQKTVLVE